MSVAHAFARVAVAAALIGPTQPGFAQMPQSAGVDRRILFDPTPLDVGPVSADRGAAADQARKPPASDFSYRGLDLAGFGTSAEPAAGLGRFDNLVSSPPSAFGPLGPRTTVGPFAIGIETDRASSSRPLVNDDTPIGQKPPKRFVPFIGLSAKQTLE